MIPRRVSLRGFLSYRDEQVIDFAGSGLWMLAGHNGSGKSGVFDAVTFALFGQHRGGAQQHTELIHKDESELTVAFDFNLGDRTFRAKRTLRRTKTGSSATQQVLQAEGESWRPVATTEKKAGFDDWVRQHVGLNYDTFTASVLLLQGRAEKLLNNTPKERFEVLAGVVDLDRYRKLHERADEQRRRMEGEWKAVQQQLQAVPAVDPTRVAELDEQIAECERRRTEATAQVEHWRQMEVLARQWAAANRAAAELQSKWTRSQGLIADAAAIDRDVRRLRELTAVVPHLESVLKQGREVIELQTRADNANRELKEYVTSLTAVGLALEQDERKRQSLQARLMESEQRRDRLAEQLKAAAAALARVENWEARDQEAKQCESELKRFPADLDERADKSRAECRSLEEVAAEVPRWDALVKAATSWSDADARWRQATADEARIQAEGERHKAALKEFEPNRIAAADARRKADEAVTRAETLDRQARDELKLFAELDGAKVCRQCGQSLTPEHFALELDLRRKSAKEAAAALTVARRQRESAVAAQALADQEYERLEKALTEKRDEYRDARSRGSAAREERHRRSAELSECWHQLSDDGRALVGPLAEDDWSPAREPAAKRWRELRELARRLPTARQALEQLQEQLKQLAGCRSRAEAARAAAAEARQRLTAEPAAVRAEHVRLEADARAVAGQLDALKREDRDIGQAIDRQQKQRRELEQSQAKVNAELNGLAASMKLLRKQRTDAIAGLPPEWRDRSETVGLSELNSWKTERQALTERQVEMRAAELATARTAVEALQAEMEAAAAKLAEFPEDARASTEQVALKTAEARQSAKQWDEAITRTAGERAVLEQRRRQREELQAAALERQGEAATYATLAELLGPKRLQLHLVRRAERQIVGHANAVLDRLSGGQLSLRLRDADGDAASEKALDLEVVNRQTSGEPLGVAFLSGSQRFRVAVSLALGIGQYASRGHRPIESVIIDEGFGCLDRFGRQVMIQELQNLRGHLNCILLVSHQEEFAEAFTHGYRFELCDGATKVERVER